jgi:hypothetical protein
MTSEDRAARKALLSLARWHRREAKKWKRMAESTMDQAVIASRTLVAHIHLESAREAERRARRIGK